MIEHGLRNLDNCSDDICNLFRFIEFSQNNYPMYSQEDADDMFWIDGK